MFWTTSLPFLGMKYWTQKAFKWRWNLNKSTWFLYGVLSAVFPQYIDKTLRIMHNSAWFSSVLTWKLCQCILCISNISTLHFKKSDFFYIQTTSISSLFLYYTIKWFWDDQIQILRLRYVEYSLFPQWITVLFLKIMLSASFWAMK